MSERPAIPSPSPAGRPTVALRVHAAVLANKRMAERLKIRLSILIFRIGLRLDHFSTVGHTPYMGGTQYDQNNTIFILHLLFIWRAKAKKFRVRKVSVEPRIHFGVR